MSKCVFRCDQPPEAHFSWLTTQGRQGGPMFGFHMAEAWERLSAPFKEAVIIEDLEG